MFPGISKKMGVFKALSKKLVQSAVRRGHRQAQQQLLSLSNRQLNDLGVSRLKLLEGVSAWPWMTESKQDMGLEMPMAGLSLAPVVTTVVQTTIEVAQEQRQVA